MRRLVFLGIFGLLGFVATQAQATLIQKMDVEELTHVADLVVRGNVENVHTELDANTGRPYTYTTIAAQQIYKGEKPAKLVLRQIGGTLGGKTIWIAGTARFEVGEEVLVFLGNSDGRYVVRGMGQGAFRIVRTTAQPMVEQKFESASAVSQSPDGARKLEEIRPLSMTLAELEKAISAALSSIPAREGN
jgi:hypothetical protein